MKKNLLRSFLLFFAVLAMIGCGLSTGHVTIPDAKYKSNYDKMFDTAISTGVQLGYNPTYQDKKTGLITMQKIINKNDTFTVNLRFGSVPGGQGFEITGRSTDLNPFISTDTNRIKNAVLQVAGVSLEASKASASSAQDKTKSKKK